MSKGRKTKFHEAWGSSRVERFGEKHIPNKQEAKELRKIKHETGLTENEIRKVYEYRVRLSEAQKKNNPLVKTKFEIDKKDFELIKKEVTKDLKLGGEHYKVIDELESRIHSKLTIIDGNNFLPLFLLEHKKKSNYYNQKKNK